MLERAHPHVVPLSVYFKTFAALLVGLALTVLAAGVHIGPEGTSFFNNVVAMTIAVAKAVLVVLYFMHLRYDNLFYSFIFLVGLVFVGLFISLALLDTFQYQPDIQSPPPSAAASAQWLRAPASV